jgi:hypothetical protein
MRQERYMQTRSAPRTHEYLIAAMIYAAGLAVWFGAIGVKLAAML